MSTPNPATTPWVPVWNLNGATPLNYRGAWAAGTYADGDIVVQNGIAYLCVRPTTNPPAPWPMAPGTSSYGTTLPASPYDGQEAVLVDSVTNPSYQWRFRYNAGSSSTYKWEFIGGAPAQNEIATSEQVTGNVYVDMPTPGPLLTVPRAGDYDIEWSAEIVHQTATGYAVSAPKLGAAATSDADAAEIYDLAGNNKRVARKIRRTLAASDLVKIQYRSGDANACAAMRRNLHVVPARVS